MSERFSLHLLYVLVLMEFQRFGLTSVRQELADQCAYEVFCALSEDTELKDRAPEVYAWRSHQTEDGREWRYPHDESGLGSCITDSRHVGGEQCDQTGVRVSAYTCLLAAKTPGFEQLEGIARKILRPYVLEEARMRSDFEHELRQAEREVTEKYKVKAKDRFIQAMAAAKTGAS